jgi:hypothetical protein
LQDLGVAHGVVVVEEQLRIGEGFEIARGGVPDARVAAEFSKVRFSAMKSLAWMKTVCVANVLMGPFGPGRPAWELLVMTVVPGSSPRKVRNGLA